MVGKRRLNSVQIVRHDAVISEAEHASKAWSTSSVTTSVWRIGCWHRMHRPVEWTRRRCSASSTPDLRLPKSSSSHEVPDCRRTPLAARAMTRHPRCHGTPEWSTTLRKHEWRIRPQRHIPSSVKHLLLTSGDIDGGLVERGTRSLSQVGRAIMLMAVTTTMTWSGEMSDLSCHVVSAAKATSM